MKKRGRIKKNTFLFKYSNASLLKLTWLNLFFLFCAHFLLNWFFIYLANESDIVEPVNWVYFYATTATTIGYGDLSPSTYQGRLITSFLLMPGAVLMFAAFIGKLSSSMILIWRKSMYGKADYSYLKKHIVILGWKLGRTQKMLELIFADDKSIQPEVVLCTIARIENPDPARIKFVQSASLTGKDVFHRSGIVTADRVIIYRDTDDQSLAACLAVSATDTKAHIVTWFRDEAKADLVRAHCPQVECHSNIIVELLVRSTQDPGSSRVQNQLLSTLEGPTQYSVKIPSDFGGTTFEKLLSYFKSTHEAIVLGVAESAIGPDLHLNPEKDFKVCAGHLVYFIANMRIEEKDILWNQIPSQ